MLESKQKQTGFTLIELLAVIVILAVIVLIAIPLVLNIIERAEIGAFKDSVYGIMEAAEFQVILDESKYPITYVFPEDSQLIKFKGTNPSEGYLQIVAEGKIKLALGNGRWCAIKEIDESQIVIKNGHCEKINLGKPMISGYGDLEQSINLNEIYVMPNVTAVDKDGNKLNVTTIMKQGDKVVDSIDTSKVSSYTITYTTEPDKQGNISTVIVTIQVIRKESDTDKIVENGIASGDLEKISDTYYYRGANPNNYVWFNDELWRIISIEDGRMKIIRKESIGNICWDGSGSYGTHDWNRPASMNTYLNETFYNTLSDKAKNQMQEGKYNVGIINYNVRTSAASVKTQEMASVWVGKVGLMNASDYVYAAKTDDSNTSACLNKAIYNAVCKSSNWLYLGSNEWTINASSSATYYAFYVRGSGHLHDNSRTTKDGIRTLSSLATRPTIFLKSSIKIAPGGKGTEDSPYIIQ